jgi:hypothetical protein
MRRGDPGEQRNLSHSPAASKCRKEMKIFDWPKSRAYRQSQADKESCRTIMVSSCSQRRLKYFPRRLEPTPRLQERAGARCGNS